MTSFLDVLRPLTEQLEILSAKTQAAVSQYTTDTTQFQHYVLSNISGVQGSVAFLGQGAEACVAAVNRNVSRSQHVITKLSDFQLACSQTKSGLEEMSAPFDQESLYHLGTHDLYGALDVTTGDPHQTTVAQYFRESQGYSPYDTTDLNTTIIWRIREDTLPGLCWQIDTLLTPGKGQALVEEQIEYAVSCIRSDFERFRLQKHDELDYAHHHGMEDEAYKYYVANADAMFNLAMHYVGVIAEKMKKGYTEWVMELQVIVGQFQFDMTAAAAINEPSIGNLIFEANQGPAADAKVLVWQTPNGLVVMVKDGTDVAAVEAAIQRYIEQNGLKGNVPITLLGYKDGGVAQQVVLDQEGNQHYHVTNLVLVGSALSEKLPDGVNYFSYQEQPEPEEEKETTFLGLKPDQIIIPLAAVTVGILTDGVGDAALLPVLGEAAKDVGTEYILAEGWNAMEKWNKEHPGEHMPMSQSPLPVYIDKGDGSGVHLITYEEETQLANNQLPHAKIYFKSSHFIPKEPGVNMEDYTNSSYLNSQLVPDPNMDALPHGGALPVSG